ncbi:MAG: ABC transporter ATP-binding protein [Lachnospiraceae bacterium]|nr:ABC transporter ATP-binding protein [Lachnospiraceae bacterium]MDY4165322.1 ABC transporter ATP-binding protein [Lachnospiraceae bacterium]
MRFAAHYLGEYKKESILAPIFKMLEAIFELFVPLVMAKIIDVGIAQSDKGYILRMCGLLMLLAVIGLIVAITAQYFSAKAAINAAGRIRSDVFFHIMKFSRGTLETAGTASLVTRITNDVNQVQNGMNMFLRLFLRSPFIVFGAMIMSFTVDVKAALVFCVVIPVLGLVVYLVMRATLPKFKRIQEGLEKILLTVNENLEGVRVIRAFRVEDKQDKKFKDETSDLYGRQISSGRISALLNPVTYAVINLGIAAVLWISGGQVYTGDLTQGEAVALINYMSQILVELIKLANLILLLTRAISSADRLEEVLKTEPDERTHEKNSSSAEENSENAIEFKNLSFTYPGSRDYSLSDISIMLKKGQSLGIIGGTGSGKSSLVRLLRHAYDPTSGELLLFGKDIREYSDEELVRKIGHVPQKANLFAGTIAYNLRLAKPDASEQEMWEALEEAQAKEIVENKENKLEEQIQRGGTNFSGGQKQRLTIARALIKKPQLLILDDSASALDMLTERHLHDAIEKLPWHPTSVIISQRASSVMTCDQILVLEGGKAVGLGTSEELLKTCPIYKEIYTTQFEYKEARA